MFWCVILRDSLSVIHSSGADIDTISSTRPQYSLTQDLKWNDARSFAHLHDVTCYYIICNLRHSCRYFVNATCVTLLPKILLVDRVGSCLVISSWLFHCRQRPDQYWYFAGFIVCLRNPWKWSDLVLKLKVLESTCTWKFKRPWMLGSSIFGTAAISEDWHFMRKNFGPWIQNKLMMTAVYH